MLFDIPSKANWNKLETIGNVKLITCVNASNTKYKVGNKILVRKQVLSAEKSM